MVEIIIMAVPIRKNDTVHLKKILGILDDISNIRLEYSGKKSVDEILNISAGNYQTDPCCSTLENNRLYFGDNLSALASLLKDSTVVGNVKLIYIDPPFATDASFSSRSQVHAYDDFIIGHAFIESLRERLIFLHKLLSNDGSLYLHLDSRMVFHMRIILDEIFGEENFRGCITRKKCNPKNYTKKTYGNVSDYILFYSKSDDFIWNRPFLPWDETKISKEYINVDENGRRFKKVPIHAPGVRNGETGKAWKGMMPPPGKHWQYKPSTLDEMDARGEIYWSSNGNPRRKVFLDNSNGIPIQDIWLDVPDAHNQNIYITGYPTEKSPLLLSRIIAASSNPGDLVLDCYSGSGTTLAVSSKMKRRWIGIDRSEEAIKATLKRFESGTEKMGDFVKNTAKDEDKTHTPIRDFVLYNEI